MSSRADLSEETRRFWAVTFSVVGWTGSAAIVVGRAFEWIPIQWGSLGLLSIGVAIASSLTLSRMRLSRTITQVFVAGLEAERACCPKDTAERKGE